MKRARVVSVVSVVLLPLAACEPTLDPGQAPESNSRFAAPGAGEDGRADDDLLGGGAFDDGQVDQQPDWTVDEPAAPGEGYPDEGEEVTALALRDGYLRGELGPVVDLNAPAGDLYGTQMEGWLNVTTTVEVEPRLAMTILDVAGDLDQLERGRTYRYGYDGLAEGAPDAPWLMMVGCTTAPNPDDGFDYDQPADEVEVTVEEPSPDTVLVDYEARFAQYDDYGTLTGHAVVNGRFSYTR